MNLEVWCEACREWWPLTAGHGLQRPRRGTHRYPRRVRLTSPTPGEEQK